MWKCKQCGGINDDDGNFCATCGYRRPGGGGGETGNLKRPPESFSCKQAKNLEKLSSGWILAVYGTVLAAVLAFFTVGEQYNAGSWFLSWLQTLLFNSLIIDGIVFLLRPLFSALAVLVENAYRSMKGE